jgi:hypothetical protein
MSVAEGEQSAAASARFDLGPSLLQLIVSEIDNRATTKPADVIATLAFFAGRIVQRTAFHEQPASFRLDQSNNGVSFLRSDAVTEKLFAIKSGTLASKLVESSLLCGANRFPDFLTTRQNAHEMMQRRAGFSVPENLMSDTPDRLAAEIQTDIDSLLVYSDDRQDLTTGIFDACALAVGYTRHKIEPVTAAELAMSVALYAGWLDQRKIGAR